MLQETDCIPDKRFLVSKGQARSVVYQRGLIDSAPFLNAFKMVGGLFPIRSGNMKAVGREEGKGWLLRWEWNGGDGVESMTVQTAEGGGRVGSKWKCRVEVEEVRDGRCQWRKSERSKN